MIKSKLDLKYYLEQDMGFYHRLSQKDRIMCWIIRDPAYEIKRYLRALRKEEYYHNCGKGLVGRCLNLWYFRKKNQIGNKLGFKIPRNTFGPGLTIYHHGEIIVNENAVVGANAKLHGGNCIGNNGKNDKSPIIGDNLDLGIGAKVIGNVVLGNRICAGANAVVTKSFLEDGSVLVGLPARRI